MVSYTREFTPLPLFLNADPSSPTINEYGIKYSKNIRNQLKITWIPLK